MFVSQRCIICPRSWIYCFQCVRKQKLVTQIYPRWRPLLSIFAIPVAK